MFEICLSDPKVDVTGQLEASAAEIARKKVAAALRLEPAHRRPSGVWRDNTSTSPARRDIPFRASHRFGRASN